jgi:hypothetical protein
MRLLEYTSEEEFVLTKDLIGDDEIPPYAILSHTWKDSEEVSFNELVNGTGKSKKGYEKIRFCGRQAKRDGLQYFWVDTCCIDKSNQVELQDAINSMFRWYQNATICYVYLQDVSVAGRKASSELYESIWEQNFRASKWFTRGWTLQELLAPRSVEFFSMEGEPLGDKGSLELQISEITGIPTLALRGTPLCDFSVEERLSWTKKRQTTRKEDKAYSLLGVFSIFMLLNYGEGEENAFKRLRKKLEKPLQTLLQQAPGGLETEDRQCIRDLRSTDPRDDKKRIEDTKGGLLEDSYRWILENPEFLRWRNRDHDPLLWIKGDPGKGKTMLLCGIINEMKRSMTTHLLSYFFCQATDSRINNATAVLRGLLYMLVVQQPSLIQHVRKKHDHAGKALFEDSNAWVALSEIFTNLLEDPSLYDTYLVIDALDECVTDLRKLLDLIAQTSSASSRVKWIVSSRNWPDIEERLERAGHKVKLSLELNAKSISTAVGVFIRHKVRQLAERNKYDGRTRNAVLAYLSSNAHDTFLWVALVCRNLEDVPRRHTIIKLNAFPPGLDSLYERMMKQISISDDASICKEILAVATIVYRPTTLDELVTLVEPLDAVRDDPNVIEEIIGYCGSFLTLRENTLYFVHQSARDFLLANASYDIFPSGKEEVHRVLFARSLQVMSITLKRDMYNLREPGYLINEVKQPDIDPLRASRYSCIYWIDHLCDWISRSSIRNQDILCSGGAVDSFIRKKFLYWLEALSLCKSMSKGVVSIAKLAAVTEVNSY